MLTSLAWAVRQNFKCTAQFMIHTLLWQVLDGDWMNENDITDTREVWNVIICMCIRIVNLNSAWFVPEIVSRNNHFTIQDGNQTTVTKLTNWLRVSKWDSLIGWRAQVATPYYYSDSLLPLDKQSGITRLDGLALACSGPLLTITLE